MYVYIFGVLLYEHVHVYESSTLLSFHLNAGVMVLNTLYNVDWRLEIGDQEKRREGKRFPSFLVRLSFFACVHVSGPGMCTTGVENYDFKIFN